MSNIRHINRDRAVVIRRGVIGIIATEWDTDA